MSFSQNLDLKKKKMSPEVKRDFFLVKILTFSNKSKNVSRSEKKIIFGQNFDFFEKTKNAP